MRIIIIQEAGRHDANKHFRECLSMQRSLIKLGVDTDVWGLGHENYENKPEWNNYDAILNLENYDSLGWLPNLSLVKSKKILWSIDAHCRGLGVYNHIFNNGNYDLMLQATKDFVDNNSVWFPNCYDSSLIKVRDEVKKTNFIGFCGSVLHRKEILNFLSNKYDLKEDIWVLGEDMVKAINSYDIHFNLNLSNDINYRSFETLGCGTALLTNQNYQYEELGFHDGVNSIFYSTVEEIVEKLDFYKNSPAELAKIQRNAIDLAKMHTYDERASRLLSVINEI